jgi:predicted PurR-regulated permease PerM
LTELAGDVPGLTAQAQTLVLSVYERYRSIPIPASVREVFMANVHNIEGALIQGIQTAIDTLLGFFSNLFSLILAPILAFYLLKDWAHIGRRVKSLFPVNWEASITSLWEDVDRVLIGFIRGYLFVSVIVGVFTGIGLSLIGMDFVVLLGIIAGFTNFIPYFGAIIAAVPVVVLALLVSPTLALQAMVVMLVVQQTESNLITPAVLGESVGLHPVTIVFVLLAGGSLFGLLGLLLAVPVAAVIRIIFGYAYSNLVS